MSVFACLMNYLCHQRPRLGSCLNVPACVCRISKCCKNISRGAVFFYFRKTNKFFNVSHKLRADRARLHDCVAQHLMLDRRVLTIFVEEFIMETRITLDSHFNIMLFELINN